MELSSVTDTNTPLSLKNDKGISKFSLWSYNYELGIQSIFFVCYHALILLGYMFAQKQILATTVEKTDYLDILCIIPNPKSSI